MGVPTTRSNSGYCVKVRRRGKEFRVATRPVAGRGHRRSGRCVADITSRAAKESRTAFGHSTADAFAAEPPAGRGVGPWLDQSCGVVKRVAASDRLQRIEIDDALIALFIAAMNANGHVSRQELARAHHLIWSTRRFRRKSGEAVGRLVDRAKRKLEGEDAASVIVAATKRIPTTLRLPAYAIVADLVLAEGGIDARERKFLEQLASRLRLSASRAREVVAAMVVKNRL